MWIERATQRRWDFTKTTNWKTRISLLWVLITIAMMVQILLTWSGTAFQRNCWFLDPARLGNQTSCVLMGVAIFLLIPLVAAYLSVVLRSLANRLLNLVLGVVYASFTIANIVSSFSRSSAWSSSTVSVQPLGAQILFPFTTLVACGLIIVHTWISPRHEAPASHRQNDW